MRVLCWGPSYKYGGATVMSAVYSQGASNKMITRVLGKGKRSVIRHDRPENQDDPGPLYLLRDKGEPKTSTRCQREGLFCLPCASRKCADSYPSFLPIPEGGDSASARMGIVSFFLGFICTWAGSEGTVSEGRGWCVRVGARVGMRGK